MVKRLLTTFFLIALAGNSLSALAPHPDGAGGCGAECCEAARQDGPSAAISAVCCMTECREDAETTAPTSTSGGLKLLPLGRLAGGFASVSSQDSTLQLTRFPVSPTRFLYGSSHRYLDLGALLI
ncbi:MAG: hypothetical protein ACREEM_06075 [Blastocatellia bacterium]